MNIVLLNLTREFLLLLTDTPFSPKDDNKNLIIPDNYHETSKNDNIPNKLWSLLIVHRKTKQWEIGGNQAGNCSLTLFFTLKIAWTFEVSN